MLTPLIEPSAGPAERARLAAPDTGELTVDGVAVKAAIAQPIGDPGDKFHLTLTSDKEVQLGIVVLGSSGTEGGRVPNPPRAVAHQTVTLVPDKKTGIATRDVALRLAGAAFSSDEYATYKVYVMSAPAGARLQGLVDRAGPSVSTGDEIPEMDTDTQKLFSVIYSDIQQHQEPETRDGKLFAEGSVAILEAYTRPVQSEVGFAAPDKAKVNEPFEVSVTVRNPHDYAMTDLKVGVDVMSIGRDYVGLPADDVVIDEPEVVSLEAHQKKTVKVHVTAPVAGLLGLHANAMCSEYCRGADAKLRIGTFDAIEIGAAEPARVVTN